MQGYILQIVPQKNEGIILQVLMPKKLKKLYRFYGARHSIIQLGRKIDFEIEYNANFLPKMRNITPLYFSFDQELERLYIWQHFIGLLHKHFVGVEEIEEFYYHMLDSGAHKMQRQNPMRVILEMYVSLLHFEGRLPDLQQCFLCSESLGEEMSFGRAFLPAHLDCIQGGQSFLRKDVHKLFKTLSSVHLDDCEVAKLYDIVGLGI